MRKAERLFQIVNLIRVHQPITAATLAQRLGVSVRSIYRYIDDIAQSGIPVYGEGGLGYQVHKDFELPPLSLNPNELEALVLAVEMLSRSVGNELSAAALSLLAKIEAALPTPVKARAQANIRALSSPYTQQQKLYWDQLHAAIRGQAAVHIRYQSLDELSSQRSIFPLGIFYWGGKWTVAAWCCLRQDYRDFRIDRILSLAVVEPGDLPVPAPGISLSAYMQRHAELWKKSHPD